MNEIQNIIDQDPESIFEDASKGMRFSGYLIDTIFAYILIFVFGMIYGILHSNVDLDSDENNLYFQFLGVVIILAYYIFTEVLFGRSLAKFILGLHVVNEEGEVASKGQLLGRTFGRLIPFDAITFLFGEGLHDRVSHTRVVKFIRK